MAYESVHLEDSITIENIISIHYFQYMSDFSFPGESHGAGLCGPWRNRRNCR